MTQQIFSHRYDNGLTLVAEAMPWLESAAFAVLLPAGAARDPADRIGVANFTCEMVQRGCGERDSRRFVEDLENFGVDRSASVTASHTSFGGAAPADRLVQALDIYADLVQTPHLPSDQLEEGRLVCIQEVRAVEDDLSQKALQELQRRFYAEPLGRSPQGTMESVAAITSDDVRSCFEAHYSPVETIISVAGNINWEELKEKVGASFGEWSARELPPIETTAPERGNHHIDHQSSQTQIAVAYPAVPYSHPDYYRARGAVGVLSGGMSSRLFTEVREKRGLCYSIYAMMHSLRDRAGVFCYAGTSTGPCARDAGCTRRGTATSTSRNRTSRTRSFEGTDP